MGRIHRSGTGSIVVDKYDGWLRGCNIQQSNSVFAVGRCKLVDSGIRFSLLPWSVSLENALPCATRASREPRKPSAEELAIALNLGSEIERRQPLQAHNQSHTSTLLLVRYILLTFDEFIKWIVPTSENGSDTIVSWWGRFGDLP